MTADAAKTGLLRGKAAFVFGASRGIGAETARAFVRNGARVVVSSRDRAKLEDLAADLAAEGGEVLVFPADATKPETVEAAIAFTVSSFGRLDIAFNNAGTNPVRALFAEHSLEDYHDVIATNLTAVFVAMRAEIAAMLKSGGGSIVNTSSSAGLVGMPRMSAYVASKHGVIGLTKAAALEYAPRNIRVNAIAPGAVLTQMLREGTGATEEGLARVRSFTPMARIAPPDEVAGAVVWLASDQASFVTGITVPVDGGFVIP